MSSQHAVQPESEPEQPLPKYACPDCAQGRGRAGESPEGDEPSMVVDDLMASVESDFMRGYQSTSLQSKVSFSANDYIWSPEIDDVIHATDALAHKSSSSSLFKHSSKAWVEIEADGPQFKTEAPTVFSMSRAKPAWLVMLLAVVGVEDLQDRILRENERRAEAKFNNRWESVNSLVSHKHFEITIGLIILFNCFFIGLEAWVEPGEMVVFLSAVEHMFTAVYVIELSLRILAFGWTWVFEFTNGLEFLLVAFTGVFRKWFAEPLGFDQDVAFLKQLSVLRTLRLVRLVRAVKLLPAFKEAWVLIHGLLISARPLLWAFVLLLSIVYVFAVMSTQLIASHEDFIEEDRVQEQFGDTAKAMVSFIRILTLDTWADTVVRPLMAKQPGLVFFFIVFISLTVYVVLNLITAIIVDNASGIAKEDNEALAKLAEVEKKRELKILTELFLEIDVDQTGDVDKEEFFAGIQFPKVKEQLDLLQIKTAELEEIWYVLDDGDGVLSIKEFTDGLRRMKGPAQAKDVQDIEKRIRQVTEKHRKTETLVDDFNHKMQEIELDTRQIASDTHAALNLFHEMYHRLDAFVLRGDKDDAKNRSNRQRAEEARALEDDSDSGSDDEEGHPSSMDDDDDMIFAAGA